ncbi:hypothetical protein [Saccharothrix sp. HUAS TT1]|uniref:hypothetical protein n=1 Tax=unclassified Saccharothrix TaxID=2593673 RepID=UPI00345C464A
MFEAPEDEIDKVDPEMLKLSKESVAFWARKGKTQAQIARLFGYTRARINQVWTEAGLPKPPKQVVREEFPWEIDQRFKSSALHKRLSDHAEYYATNGEGMSEDKLKRLLSFYGKLKSRNAVVEYSPDVEPNPDSGMGGFRLVPRRPEDGDLIVRVNEISKITDEGRRIFSMPGELPKVKY